jgi:hypothetical protein
VAGYRRTDKKRNTDLRQKLKNIQPRKENKEITAELLGTYPKNANLSNPSKNIQLSP